MAHSASSRRTSLRDTLWEDRARGTTDLDRDLHRIDGTLRPGGGDVRPGRQRQTVGENIADLTALVLGYDAYLASLESEEPPIVDGFTGEQRYFISYAQVWRNKLREEALRQWILFGHASPPEVRVNGPLKHFPEFYEAFDVQPGDGIRLPPEARVKIW